MTDTERLATDRAYWDSVAPEGATHYQPQQQMFYKRNGKDNWRVYSNRWWKSPATSDSALWVKRPEQWIDGLPPVGVECEMRPMDDNCPAARIGELGNQVHNLGCEYQNDEDLSDELGKFASSLWDLAKKAGARTDARPKWNGEGLPPVGCECEFQNTIGEPWYVVQIIAHFERSAVFAAGDDYPNGCYDGCSHPENFRPLKTQAERERDEVENKALDEVYWRIGDDNLVRTVKETVAAPYDAGMLRKQED